MFQSKACRDRLCATSRAGHFLAPKTSSFLGTKKERKIEYFRYSSMRVLCHLCGVSCLYCLPSPAPHWQISCRLVSCLLCPPYFHHCVVASLLYPAYLCFPSLLGYLLSPALSCPRPIVSWFPSRPVLFCPALSCGVRCACQLS